MTDPLDFDGLVGLVAGGIRDALLDYGVNRETITNDPEIGTLARAILRAVLPHVLAGPREALEGVTERYVDLAGSGDCGHWDPEEEIFVINARAELARIDKLTVGMSREGETG